MLHDIATDKRACSAQSGLAMDSQDSWVSLAHLKELVYDEVRWCRSINEEHISVVNAALGELSPVVLCLVQAHHMCDAEVTEHLHIVFWRVSSPVRSDLVHRAHKGDEFSRYDPIQVTILDFFIVLILLIVKLSKVIPAVADGDF